MTTIVLSVPVPIDFDVSILSETSAMENAIIIKSGFNILKASRDEACALNNEGARMRLEKSYAERSEIERVRFEKTKEALLAEAISVKERQEKEASVKITDLQKALERARSELAVSDSARAAAETQIAEATKRAREAGEATSQASLQKAEALISDLTARISKEKEMVFSIQLEAERSKAEAVAAAKVAVEERAEALHKKQRDEFQQRLMEITARQAGSSTKGQDYEREFADLLFTAFSGHRDYKVYEHKIESGDHIIGFDGQKMMYENKKYGKMVSKHEVDKAHRDFIKHTECAALVFVSEDSEISEHQRPGNLDIGFVDGRPVIYVGKFGSSPDKVGQLQMIHMIVVELLAQMKKAAASDNMDQIEDFKAKITTLRRYFTETNEDLGELVKGAKVYQRAQKEAWDVLYGKINTTVEKFGRRIRVALSDDVDEPESSVSAKAECDESQVAENSAPKVVPFVAAEKSVEKMNLVDLRDACKKKGFKGLSGKNKEALVALLR